ncbi:hypothetical protein THASP1DRAFT_24655 [Thamnocephalis sphaerospora]|uniref:Uncharacterized protein n=1 Tax=Thamnocephalis sphaerospora TaxID=78915 RepID=A0A4P9XMM8_9FUNG|nr:hypothetical protein THASP1DRAFT_24655 [Thamnocephalis sphaerospora]|eukprot:RKP07136.1 hypothetical protein THASP1DRAFT_24655 [Thamnocephalis sphaerospora]
MPISIYIADTVAAAMTADRAHAATGAHTDLVTTSVGGRTNGLGPGRTVHPLLDDDTVSRVADEFYKSMVAARGHADGQEAPDCNDEAHLHQLVSYFTATALNGDLEHARAMKSTFYDAARQPVTHRFFDYALHHLDAALQAHVPAEVARQIVTAVQKIRAEVVTEDLRQT